MATANTSYNELSAELNELQGYKTQLESYGGDTTEVDKRINNLKDTLKYDRAYTKGDNSDIAKSIEEASNAYSSNNASIAAQNESNQIADTSKTSARNEGLNKSASALLSGQDASTNYARGYSTANQTMANQSAMTQADWLAKQGDVASLQQTANNTQAGAGAATFGAILQGLSDERAKEAPNEYDKLYEERLLNAVDDYLKLVQKVSAKKRGGK